ncbi:hypothetical protein GCM10020258_26830 [Sphingomonas yabuuchiae]
MTLAERLAAAMARIPATDLLTGDGVEPHEIMATPTAAAVLVPVTDRAEPGVLLTQRTETLRNHAGQIAFPGGRADPGDVDLVATALREAEEEIGLSPATVTVVGLADRYRTVTGFEVTPIVGVIPPDLTLTPPRRKWRTCSRCRCPSCSILPITTGSARRGADGPAISMRSYGTTGASGARLPR